MCDGGFTYDYENRETMEIEESTGVHAFFGDDLFLLRRLALRCWPVRNFFKSPIFFIASHSYFHRLEFVFSYSFYYGKKDHRIQIYVQLDQPKIVVNYCFFFCFIS